MRKVGCLLTVAMLFISVIGCGSQAPTWQEQYDLGVRYLSEGNYQEAIIAFTAAIEIDPRQAPAFTGRGDAYFGLAQLSAGDAQYYTEAISDYLASVGLDAGQTDVFMKLGTTYTLTEDYPGAVDAFSSALALDDSLTEAYIGRGNAYMAILEGMLEDYNASLDETNEDGLDEWESEERGLPKEIIELYEQAKDDYLSALELDDQIVELYEKVADIYLALDDFDSAVEILERGLERTGDEALRARLDELLKSRSRIVTVTGEVIRNSEVYESPWKAYWEEYSYLDYYENGSRTGGVSIRTYGIRFAEPVVVDIDGVETVIFESEYKGHASDIGVQELTGYFQINGEYAEITPYSSGGHETVLYCPNGPYIFVPSEVK